MSCRKISRIINTAFLKKNIRYKGKQLKISFKTGIADDNSETTMDEIEDRLKKLEEITKNNKNIKYNIRFNSKVNA